MQDVTTKQFKDFIKSESSSYKEEYRVGLSIAILHFNEKDELIAIDECSSNVLRHKIRRDYIQ